VISQKDVRLDENLSYTKYLVTMLDKEVRRYAQQKLVKSKERKVIPISSKIKSNTRGGRTPPSKIIYIQT
jgi:hypothetical protein